MVDLLREQQTMTPIERFSQSHEANGHPAGDRYYRDLVPSGLPGPAEQYAFEVDLDACSGCKACVAACHNLNGLEEEETWRDVGLMVGGTDQLPVLQHVTTACHHCIEPACADGCPVEAYEKDPVTGIVRHLDDQCIGCQYCMLKCPYDVPVYSKSKGIVRKCDMCHQRLAVGEAPACVQSCPNQAIRIRVVSKQLVRDESEAHTFLPGAPDPSYTLPTTAYKSARVFPRNTLPADYFRVQPGKGHLPLVVMLVLTQMSVGAFAVEHLTYSYSTNTYADIGTAARPWHLIAALSLGLAGLVASIFHLGRPLYAYRALLGLRTSWLSREILAFTIFAGAATAYAAVAWFDVLTAWQRALGTAAALSGLAAVMCSVMIYVDTRRPLWTPVATTTRFLLTGLVLGLPVVLLISLCTAALTPDLTVAIVLDRLGRTLCRLLIGAEVTKLLVEISVLLHLGSRQYTPRKRSALLLTGELSMVMLRRVFFGVVGGIALPAVILAENLLTPGGYEPLFVGAIGLLMLGMLIVAELHERYLFFTASVAPRMPGAPVP